MGILDIKVLKDYIRMCNDGWLQGWHERNGGNLTYRMTEEEVNVLYTAMGEHFKTLGMWQFYVLTPSEDFPRLFGRRADKIRKLYNGMIPCFLYQFFKNPNKK